MNIVKIICQGSGAPSKFQDEINAALDDINSNEYAVKDISFTSDKDGKQTCNIWLQQK